jgi:hypothetical protein
LLHGRRPTTDEPIPPLSAAANMQCILPGRRGNPSSFLTIGRPYFYQAWDQPSFLQPGEEELHEFEHSTTRGEDTDPSKFRTTNSEPIISACEEGANATRLQGCFLSSQEIRNLQQQMRTQPILVAVTPTLFSNSNSKGQIS